MKRLAILFLAMCFVPSLMAQAKSAVPSVVHVQAKNEVQPGKKLTKNTRVARQPIRLICVEPQVASNGRRNKLR